ELAGRGGQVTGGRGQGAAGAAVAGRVRGGGLVRRGVLRVAAAPARGPGGGRGAAARGAVPEARRLRRRARHRPGRDAEGVPGLPRQRARRRQGGPGAPEHLPLPAAPAGRDLRAGPGRPGRPAGRRAAAQAVLLTGHLASIRIVLGANVPPSRSNSAPLPYSGVVVSAKGTMSALANSAFSASFHLA